MVDRSFGFETAVQECVRAIDSAMVEAMSCEYGVFPYVRRCLEKQRHCVLVTSEGITIPGLEGDVGLAGAAEA